MVQSTLSLARTVQGLEPRPSDREIEEVLFAYSKAEAKRFEGDDLSIEVTPDRLDLLSEGGLRQHLEGLLDRRQDLPALAVHAGIAPHLRIRVDRSVERKRPAIAAVQLEAPPGGALDSGLLTEAVRFQELLHATIGSDRRSASLGIYPVERITGPIEYTFAPVAAIRFTPLEGDRPRSGPEFFAEHPYAQQYGALGREVEETLVLRDARGTILSLPPILNSREAGEARVGDRTLLLESTGTRAARVEDALGLLELPFVAAGWSAAPVAVEFPDRADTGERFVRPRRMELGVEHVRRVTGLPLSSEEVSGLLRRARLGPSSSGSGWEVEVPPWRPDLISGDDLVEEVALARGVRVEEARLPVSSTRGRRLAQRGLREAMRDRLLGLGYVPLFSTVLSSESTVELLGHDALRLANPVSLELSRVRSALQIPLLTALRHNIRFAYPQRFSEVGPVVLKDPKAESGAATHVRAGWVIAAEGAGFADAAATLDYLLRREQLLAVREPAELPGTIPGRAARVRLAGEAIGEIGEIHPAVLDELGIPVPAAWAEIDLTALQPLLRGP